MRDVFPSRSRGEEKIDSVNGGADVPLAGVVVGGGPITEP
jgi:hypothetical protein